MRNFFRAYKDEHKNKCSNHQMFCSHAFAFMALIILKTRMLCKMHNTQKIYVGNTKKDQKKKPNKNTEKSDSTITQLLFYFCHFAFFVLPTQI